MIRYRCADDTNEMENVFFSVVLLNFLFPHNTLAFHCFSVSLAQVHTGAKLKGGFSRLDYMTRKHETVPNPSFRKLDALLPVGAR